MTVSFLSSLSSPCFTRFPFNSNESRKCQRHQSQAIFQLLPIPIYICCVGSLLREVIAVFGKAGKYETRRVGGGAFHLFLFECLTCLLESLSVYKEAIKHTMGFVEFTFQQSFWGVRVCWIWLRNIKLLTLREVFHSWGGGRHGCGWIGWLV